ncbi:MAG: L,D-transpeptidase family protein [Chitinophagaceae bacterium]
MKSILICSSLILSLLLSCTSQNSSDAEEFETTEDGPKAESEKKISKRDISITRANSYSDLFMDSAAVVNYLKENAIPDSVARRIRSFYNARNYQYAWFTGTGLTEQARGFWNLHDYYNSYTKDSTLKNKQLQRKMDNLVAEETLSVSNSDKSMLQTEITLTRHFIQYMKTAYGAGFVKRKEMERFVPMKKRDVLEVADSLIKKKHKDNKYFEEANLRYGQLKSHLNHYHALAAKGGWQPITITGKSLKLGAVSPSVLLVKQRLQMTGDLLTPDTSLVFNDTLETAVKSFQVRHGYTPDGVIGASVLREMNVPVQTRLEQILINMERMRWMPNEPASDNLIVVNIPEYVLHMYEGKKKVWDMNVVVGKDGHNTTVFTGDLNQVVFSPHWNVPESIVKDEILPKMASDPGYLQAQNMEVVSDNGGSGLPTIRQLPGGKNALGNVKFLFPNSFNIYFHDTPSKSLFEKDKRAYSHGCIRLSDPTKMAQYLLRNQSEWTPDRIEEAMNAGEEKFVKVKKAVPVFITYYTAWVNEDGKLNFREDIYKHDRDLAQRMFSRSEQIAGN